MVIDNVEVITGLITTSVLTVLSIHRISIVTCNANAESHMYMTYLYYN